MAKELYKKCKYKHALWGGYYYSLFSDLSMVKDQGELKVHISDTYSRLFPDGLGLHNAALLPVRRDETILSSVYDVQKIVDDTVVEFFAQYNGMFWNEYRKRFDWKITLWGDITKSWNELADEQKEQCGKYRAGLHNGAIKHGGTYQENIAILKDFGKWCEDNQIKLHIVNFPVTNEYREHFNPLFKEIYYKALSEFDFPFELYDFDEVADFFDGDDFNDTDHLNDKGAYKLTEALRNLVK